MDRKRSHHFSCRCLLGTCLWTMYPVRYPSETRRLSGRSASQQEVRDETTKKYDTFAKKMLFVLLIGNGCRRKDTMPCSV